MEVDGPYASRGLQCLGLLVQRGGVNGGMTSGFSDCCSPTAGSDGWLGTGVSCSTRQPE